MIDDHDDTLSWIKGNITETNEDTFDDELKEIDEITAQLRHMIIVYSINERLIFTERLLFFFFVLSIFLGTLLILRW